LSFWCAYQANPRSIRDVMEVADLQGCAFGIFHWIDEGGIAEHNGMNRAPLPGRSTTGMSGLARWVAGIGKVGPIAGLSEVERVADA
jgi:hypothetical protein